jgi:ornithine--oxo-acid transaminase
LHRAIIHTSTFSENRLAMRAGLATLEVLEREYLGGRAAAAGAELRGCLRQALSSFAMFKEVRGLGLLTELIHSSSAFWSEALGLARRAINI